MRKRRLAALFLAAAMTLQGMTGIAPVSAAELSGEDLTKETESVLPGTGNVLYEKTDFTSTDDLQYFAGNNDNGGNREPIYSEDAMSFDGGSAHKIIVTASEAENLTDFVYEADISVTAKGSSNDSSQAGLLFRATEVKSNMSDGYKGYYFGIDPQAQQVILGKANDGRWTEIATKKMSFKFGEFYHVTIAVSGNLITAYVDYDGAHYAKVTAVDSEFSSGSVGVRHWISSAAWKNLKVSEFRPAAVSPEDTYTNPLLNMCADPDVLYHNGTYFLYPTNAGDANDDQGIKVYTSTDLVHWTEKGFAFKKGDGWGEGNFWAPDTIERDGVFYMYYTANEHICVAESDSPLGPYKQTVMEPMHSNVKEIDAHVFYDEASDKYYMYFVRFTDGNVIWGAELNDDMKSIKEDTLKELLKANQGWDEDKGKVNEGPYMLTKDGKYYLTYSGSHFESIRYGSAYAVSDSPLGNFVKYANNPIMQSNSLAHGTGHHCVAESPDGKEMFMVYHSHHDLQSTEPRQLCIDRMQFTTDAAGNTVLEVNGPTVSPQALPSGSSDVDNFIAFDKEDLKPVRMENATASKEELAKALPAELTVNASKSSDKKASVAWNLDAYTPDEAQDVITVTGTATLPEGVANLSGSSLEVSVNVMFAELPANPKMTVKIGDKVFADFDADTSAYEIKVNELPGVTAEIAESDRNKFAVSVIQATAKNKRAYITVTSPLDAGYKKTYTIRFRGLTGLMQKMEAEDAKLTGRAAARHVGNVPSGSVVGWIDGPNDTVTFDIEASAAGTYKIGLGVYNPGEHASASHRYWVNGKESDAQIVVYPRTKGITVEVGVEVELEEGDNTFTVSHVDGDRTFAELDYIVFYTVNLKEETAQKMEAEDAVCAGQAKPRDVAAASNGKVVGNIDGAADSVTFEIEAPKDGTYKIGLGVFSPGAWGNASHRYWVNGEESNAQTICYPQIKDRTVEVGIEAALKAGRNTFTVSHVDGDRTFAELDYIVFYTAVQKMGITVGSNALEGFDIDTVYYEMDTDSQKEFPEVNVAFDESCGENFKAKVTQATEDRPEARITVTSPVDKGYLKEYLIHFNGPDTFSNPLINYGADPFVTYQDGYYYYVRVKNDKSIWVTKSAELWRIGQVEPKKVYEPSGDEPNVELWAPEIHFLNGRWYIYYTAGAGANHRMYVLESESEDAQGAYKWKGKLTPTTDKWAIDQTVLELDGQLYAVWSGWYYDQDIDQRIYLAKMENPWTITGERVELSQPEYDWEGTKEGRPWVNEGPQIAKSPDGTVNIVYSAHQSWGDNYCLGCLTLKKDGDPMDADAWIKADKPIFTKNNMTTFSTGHASFTKSPDGTEDYLVYHATRFSGHSWGGRGVRAQRVYWNADGTPDMGRANEYNSKVNIPAGTKKVNYTRYEAEDAACNGNVKIVKTNNSSNGGKLEFSDAEGAATFHVTAEKAESYRFYIKAATSKENAAFSVKVNDADAIIKDILAFNTNPNDIDGRTCTDNWFGYELDAALKSGENTVVVSVAEGKEAADLDYIELCRLEDAELPNPGADVPVDQDAKKPVITKQPLQASYTEKEEAEALSVEAEVSDGGTLSYQWYQNSSNSTEGASAIKGATKASYTPSTEAAGTIYYYCAVTNTNTNVTGNQAATANSRIVSITVTEKGVKPVDAKAPVISKEPEGKNYSVGDTADALALTAEAEDGGTLSYQWYRNNRNSTEGAEAIKGATKASYVPSTEAAGTTYYYCTVTNTNTNVTGNQTATTDSRIVFVTIREKGTEPVDAAHPAITKQPVQAAYTVNQKAEALLVEASVEDNGTLSYQWYQNSNNSTEGAEAIKGATEASYVPSTETAGTVYYYCTVTNTNAAATGTKTAAVNTAIVSITVDKAENPIMKISGYSKAIGSKLTLKAAGPATYKTSNKKVVTVTSKGAVTFKGIGKATITVNAKGDAYYKAAVKKISFTVTPKKIQMKSVKSSKSRSITVKWKKDKKVSGYEIQYSVRKDFKGAKTKKIKKNATESVKISRLKGGKKYYVRVRSYKTVSKKPIRSDWSKVKQVKVKK